MLRPFTAPSDVRFCPFYGRGDRIPHPAAKEIRMNLRRTSALFVLALSASVFVPSSASNHKVPTNVAYVSEEGGQISVIDLNSFRLLRTIQPKDIAPRGISLAGDGRFVVTANKGTSDISVFDARSLRLIRRIQVGGNPEFIKIHPTEKWLFVSCEPVSASRPPGQSAASEEDNATSQIVIVNTRDWSLGRRFAAGNETEGIEFSRDGRLLIVANEGQNTLSVFNIASGQHTREVDLASYGSRPRGVKLSPQGDAYAVTMEASGTLLLLDQNFKVTHSVATGAMPDGVAFDRQGQRVVVAAARAQKIQFFSTDTLQLVGEAPVGQRCWHFTFTPDDSQIWLACGRSNSVDVIDAVTYRPVRSLTGFLLPWGIVTYPRAYGSLDLP
jgi:DNA-binding beta-propeller fold protein YncE